MRGGQRVYMPTWALISVALFYTPNDIVEASSGMTMMSPLTTMPVIRSMTSSHNGQVCSTWGNFHIKTFDGDMFRFPGVCNYVYSSHCKSHYEEFNIQIRRSLLNDVPTITHIIMKIDGVVVEMENSSIMVDGKLIEKLPSIHSRVQIEKNDLHTKVSSKIGIDFRWHDDGSLLLELDNKYANQTCGLCGDFNGISTYTEFVSNDIHLTPIQFGNLQKMDGPTEQCEDTSEETQNNCTNLEHVCTDIWSDPAFDTCQKLVGAGPYIEACSQDLCHCAGEVVSFCLCATVAEYSRQCSHASGRPKNWRRPDLCFKQCPDTMQYQECGSPCKNACSNRERTDLCDEHCVQGCFCPPGTILDDIDNRGCIPHAQCSCTYNGETYRPGMSYTTACRKCTCADGQWNCVDKPCSGTCFIEGGSHITTFDETRYKFHGDCSYVISKTSGDNKFTILGELRKCGLTDSETCLKSIHLQLTGGQTNIVIKPDGSMFVNSIYTQPPMSAADVTIFKPSSFFIIMHVNKGPQLQIQLKPVMQLFISLDQTYKGKTGGLCGNFNNIQADDFTAVSGVLEGSASAFANTWKTAAGCPIVRNIYEDPCALSIDNEKYAQHGCALLLDKEGPFAKCHPVLSPDIYYTNCMFDTCNCEKSEDCLCAALSSYVRACAYRGVLLINWRENICSKYVSSCPESQTYSYNISSCQATCRSRSERDITSSIKFVPVDGCTCQEGALMDDAGKCVPLDACPCYYKMSAMPSGEVIRESGIMCTCTQGKLSCIGEHSREPECLAPMIYIDCANSSVGARGSECQKSCRTLDMECYSTQCVSGCVCPQGLVSDDRGGCIQEELCPCIHNEVPYHSGDKIRVNCNTCTCKNRMWACTNEVCPGTCSVYGDGHYVTFDGRHFTFNGDCEYTLAQDFFGSDTSNGTFRIITENIPCGTTGTTCSKAMKVFLEGYELTMSDQHFGMVQRGSEKEIPFKIRRMGIYMVTESPNGLVIIWDKKTNIMIKLHSDFKGKICGLCGNYDGNSKNDFTTRSLAVVGDVTEFGNSWKFSPTCPDVGYSKDPCSSNPYRKSWAQKQCSIITSDVFAACHTQVSPILFYEGCVSDACACDTGGDCECFCSAVAAYAQACNEVGICIHWRSPTICPLFCDYYNPEGECEWHYMPCGAPCMKTCSNPSGKCIHDLPGLEGCYPRCPPEQPFFNEVEMKCMSKCGCYDAEDNFHDLGEKFWPREHCQTCHCTVRGIECEYDTDACLCVNEGKIYKYKELIDHTTDNIGGCFNITCGANGTVNRIYYACPPLLPQSILTTTTTESSVPPLSSTVAFSEQPPAPCVYVHEVCRWSEWYDESNPAVGRGDFETLDNLRAKGKTVCKDPREVECRAEKYIDIPLTYLGQSVQCNTSGFVCHNKDQSPPVCFNYQVRFLCCSYEACNEPPAADCLLAHETLTWTDWVDTTNPKTGDGDIETMPNIIAAGNDVCSAPRDVQCRAEDYPDTPITELGQEVKCDKLFGLTCYNKEQQNPPCLNFQIRFLCAIYSFEPCEASTLTYPPSTLSRITTVTATYKGPSASTPSSAVLSTGTPTFSNTTAAPSFSRSTTITSSSSKPISSTSATSPTGSSPSSRITVTAAYSHMPMTSTPSTLTASGLSSISSTASTLSPSITRSRPSSTESTTSVLSSSVSATSHPSTATYNVASPSSGTPPASCIYVHEVCLWSEWYDETNPADGRGDFETLENLRAKGITVCKDPREVECRAEKYPDSPLTYLGQTVQCNASGLVCQNKDQSPPVCFNYQARFLCCSSKACDEPPAANCKLAHEHLTWTEWLDVTNPQTGKGDFETIYNVKDSGIEACDAPKDVQCRAEKYPEMSIMELGQKVECDKSYGLKCYNGDQQEPPCFNYEVRFLCASYSFEPCEPPGTFTSTNATSTVLSSASYSTIPSPSQQSTSQSAYTSIATKSSTSRGTPRNATVTYRTIESVLTTKTTAYCFCEVNGTNYHPGEVLYNMTNFNGCGTYAICGDDCRVQKHLANCLFFCGHVDPPRQINEAWMIDKCAQATCLEDTSIRIDTIKCSPVENITCANGLSPKQVYTDGGCCFHYECESCTGPDGTAKMPGETWTSNCHLCSCDKETVTVKCAPVSCPLPTVPTCEKEGYELVESPMPDNPCCSSMICRCNFRHCRLTTENCLMGYRLMMSLHADDCCPTVTCEPQHICLVNETVYQPGRSIPMPADSCQECSCTHEKDLVTQLNRMECKAISCQTQCPVGYEYHKKGGLCCGECVQVACSVTTDGTTQILQPEEEWHPPGMKCSHYKCYKDSEGHFVLITVNRTCPLYEPKDCDLGVEEIQYDDCCKIRICKQETTCMKHTKATHIEHNKCWASVEMSYCEGTCTSSSKFSSVKGRMEQICTCCQEVKTSRKMKQLACPDGSSIDHTYFTADACDCQSTACVPQ
ncbi:hypothetical protein NDU88_003824 [Pleurodeles waltl]|uniref:Mucin-5AC n=1 Tax=Pleurodeles waltl TaxID=8319 RepID=A0AAV7TPG5_PLEWA|nr:hypothetical protein NDU88_003824 [Pleurodeles waltl]